MNTYVNQKQGILSWMDASGVCKESFQITNMYSMRKAFLDIRYLTIQGYKDPEKLTVEIINRRLNTKSIKIEKEILQWKMAMKNRFKFKLK